VSLVSPDDAALTPFLGDVALEALVAAVPASHAIKGMFVASNANAVSDDWSRIEPALMAPPRGGRYLAFSDYPFADFLRVSDAAVRRKFPTKGTREGHRLLSREIIGTFGESVAGRATLSWLREPEGLLRQYEEVFNVMMTGASVKVRVTDARSTDIEYDDYYGTAEAIFGVLEGIVLACHVSPRVTLETTGVGGYIARVTWHDR
jgi:uncharacterized protein (TIGR02265 family)